MKHIGESIAVIAVGLLFVTIIGLIVEYNLIDSSNDMIEDEKEIAISVEHTKKEKTSDYLKSIEGYKEVEVQVDATQEEEKSINIEKAKAELKNDDIVNEISSVVDSALK